MNTASSNNTPWVYLYPLRMSCKDEEFIEFFVTFDEPNLFVEPYDSLGIKMTATVFYLIALLGAFIQYSCIIYEVNGYAASFRTAINQLVSAAYFMVSFIWNIGSEKKNPLKNFSLQPIHPLSLDLIYFESGMAHYQLNFAGSAFFSKEPSAILDPS